MTLTLTVQSRDVTGKKVHALRGEGMLPLVVYGRGKESRSLQTSLKDFRRTYDAAGHTSLVDVVIDGGDPVKVLVHDVQQDPVTGTPLHADLYQVDMKQKIVAKIPLKVEGEAPAVRELDGTLLINHDSVEVEALPQDLPKEIGVDISILATFDDAITAGSLPLPSGVTLVTDAAVDLVFVQPPREEEVEEVVSAEDAEKAAIEGMEKAAEEEAASKADESSESKEEQ